MDRLFEPADGSVPAKRCARCGAVKPLDQFHRDRARKDGRQSYCRDCNIEQMVQYHAAHPEHCRARVKRRSDRIRAVNRSLLFEYLLTHPCVDCGESDPVVLEFDHLRDKALNVSELANRPVEWIVIAEEIAKCEVVCANCHRRRTCVRLDSYRVRAMRALVEGRDLDHGR